MNQNKNYDIGKVTDKQIEELQQSRLDAIDALEGKLSSSSRGKSIRCETSGLVHDLNAVANSLGYLHGRSIQTGHIETSYDHDTKPMYEDN